MAYKKGDVLVFYRYCPSCGSTSNERICFAYNGYASKSGDCKRSCSLAKNKKGSCKFVRVVSGFGSINHSRICSRLVKRTTKQEEFLYNLYGAHDLEENK